MSSLTKRCFDQNSLGLLVVPQPLLQAATALVAAHPHELRLAETVHQLELTRVLRELRRKPQPPQQPVHDVIVFHDSDLPQAGEGRRAFQQLADRIQPLHVTERSRDQQPSNVAAWGNRNSSVDEFTTNAAKYNCLAAKTLNRFGLQLLRDSRFSRTAEQ